MRRDVAIEIFSPVGGVHVDVPSTMLPQRSSPKEANANSFYGVVQKEYGTTLFSTATVGAPINLIYEAKFVDNTILEVFTHTNMRKFLSGTSANDGQTYTGTFTDIWKACMHNNALIYCNNIDTVQAKISSSATGTAMGGPLQLAYKSRVPVSFKEHLCLYYTVESGNNSPKRCRWTKVGLLSYTASDWTETGSGFLDIQDVEGNIIDAHPMGNNAVVVYGDGSIHIQEWVGGTSVFVFTKMMGGLSLPSRRSVVSNDSIHYILARDNVYEYKGGREWTPIADAIKASLFGEVNPNALQYAHLQYVKDDDELRVYVPTGTGTTPDRCWIYKVKEAAWHPLDRRVTATGKFTQESALTIGELLGNIGAQNWRFGDLNIAAGAPIYLLADPSGRVTQMNKTVYSVSATGTETAQIFMFDSKAITSINDVDPQVRTKYNLSKYMDNESRWIGLTVEAMGDGEMHISYSVDEGRSFTELPESPVTLTADWELYELDIDRCAPSCAIRVMNDGVNEVAHIRYAKLTFVPGSDV